MGLGLIRGGWRGGRKMQGAGGRDGSGDGSGKGEEGGGVREMLG